MVHSSHIPAGFCPFCDYAMDAGRCPECGRDVPLERLAKSVWRQRMIRRGKRAAKVVTVLAILGGLGYGVYHETRPHRWVKYCSTDYLLTQPQFRNRANVWDELTWRIHSGKFTRNQTIQYLAIMAPPPSLDIRTPRPLGSSSYVEGNYMWSWNEGCCLCNGDMRRIKEKYLTAELWVDGTFYSMFDGDQDKHELLLNLVPNLPAGRHQIEVRAPIEYFEDRRFRPFQIPNTRDIPHLPCIVTATTRLTVEIVDASAQRILKPRFDDEMIAAAQSGSLFLNWRQDWALNAGGQATPVVAGRCLVYSEGSGDDAGTCQIDFRIPHDAWIFKERFSGCARDTDQTFVMFIPDAELAFDAGCLEYFNGVVEWHDAEIKDGIPVLGVPDSIRPYDPAEFDVVASVDGP